MPAEPSPVPKDRLHVPRHHVPWHNLPVDEPSAFDKIPCPHAPPWCCCHRFPVPTGERGIINVWDIDTSALEAHATALSLAAARAASTPSVSGETDAAAAAALSGADVAATGADVARWEALVGDEGLVEELRDLFCYVQLREAGGKLGTVGPRGVGRGRALTGGFWQGLRVVVVCIAS